MKQKETTTAFMMSEIKLKKPFGLYGLYKNISAL